MPRSDELGRCRNECCERGEGANERIRERAEEQERHGREAEEHRGTERAAKQSIGPWPRRRGAERDQRGREIERPSDDIWPRNEPAERCEDERHGRAAPLSPGQREADDPKTNERCASDVEAHGRWVRAPRAVRDRERRHRDASYGPQGCESDLYVPQSAATAACSAAVASPAGVPAGK